MSNLGKLLYKVLRYIAAAGMVIVVIAIFVGRQSEVNERLTANRLLPPEEGSIAYILANGAGFGRLAPPGLYHRRRVILHGELTFRGSGTLNHTFWLSDGSGRITVRIARNHETETTALGLTAGNWVEVQGEVTDTRASDTFVTLSSLQLIARPLL